MMTMEEDRKRWNLWARAQAGPGGVEEWRPGDITQAGDRVQMAAIEGADDRMMMGPHFQAAGFPEIPTLVAELAPGTVVMALDNWELLKAIKEARPDLVTVGRHWMDEVQTFPTGKSLAYWKDHVRKTQLARFSDTLARHIDWVDYVLEQNEYNANGHSPAEKEARVLSAQAWNVVWEEDGWRQKARLVVGNAAIGNDIPLATARATYDHGNVLGYHPYIPVNGKRVLAEDPVHFPDRPEGEWVHSWPWYHGRHELMDRSFRAAGMKLDWLFTEGNPVGGHLLDNGDLVLDPNAGWVNYWVCDRDMGNLMAIVHPWLDWLTYWNRTHSGRVIGCVAFTSGPWGWEGFQVTGSEWVDLNRAQKARALGPNPWDGTSPSLTDPTPPPDPEPPPAGDCPPGSDARTAYGRRVVVVPQGWPMEARLAVAQREWTLNTGTTLTGSYDDAGIGRGLKSKVAQLDGLMEEEWEEYFDWYGNHYPDTQVVFSELAPWLAQVWPVGQPSNNPISQKWGLNPGRYVPLGVPGHDGLDFAAAEGSWVVNVATGTVLEVIEGRVTAGWGDHVRVIHSLPGGMGDLVVVYAHLSAGSIEVEVGQTLKPGDHLGKVGMTGNTDGPHLHISLKWLERPWGPYVDEVGFWPWALVDPTPYFFHLAPDQLEEGG